MASAELFVVAFKPDRSNLTTTGKLTSSTTSFLKNIPYNRNTVVHTVFLRPGTATIRPVTVSPSSRLRARRNGYGDRIRLCTVTVNIPRVSRRFMHHAQRAEGHTQLQHDNRHLDFGPRSLRGLRQVPPIQPRDIGVPSRNVEKLNRVPPPLQHESRVGGATLQSRRRALTRSWASHIP